MWWKKLKKEKCDKIHKTLWKGESFQTYDMLWQFFFLMLLLYFSSPRIQTRRNCGPVVLVRFGVCSTETFVRRNHRHFENQQFTDEYERGADSVALIYRLWECKREGMSEKGAKRDRAQHIQWPDIWKTDEYVIRHFWIVNFKQKNRFQNQLNLFYNYYIWNPRMSTIWIAPYIRSTNGKPPSRFK